MVSINQKSKDLIITHIFKDIKLYYETLILHKIFFKYKNRLGVKSLLISPKFIKDPDIKIFDYIQEKVLKFAKEKY